MENVQDFLKENLYQTRYQIFVVEKTEVHSESFT
jgi:hypothetical protein